MASRKANMITLSAAEADLTADTPMDRVSATHDFFNSAEGKVRFQLPSPETQYGWQHVSRFPDAVLKNIQTQGKPNIYYKGYLGEAMKHSFPEETQLTNRYQWDVVFPDVDIYKKGVGGQGLYVSPARDVVVAWFSTGTGNDQEETMARTIVNTW